MRPWIVSKSKAACALAMTGIMALLALSACQRLDSAANSASSPENVIASDRDPRVTLRVLDFDGLQRLIGRKRGKVVVVDAWSTSCPPCVKSFPDLVRLQNEIGPERLACISLSLDYEGSETPKQLAPKVLGFLADQQATFDNVLANEEIFTMLGKLGVSSPPAVFVYDRDGKLRDKFGEAGSKEKPIYERVGKLVEQLVR